MATPYILGLDLGSASIGWAVVETNERVVDCGVRVFDPGVNLEEFTKGAEGSSNNTTRRLARLHRRQLRRHTARQRDLFVLLQDNGLLPSGSGGPESLQRHNILERLDSDLRRRWRARLEETGIPEQSLIYLLRQRALDDRLEAHEVGRVLYHLSQRRGFKSNRRDEARLAEPKESKRKKREKDGEDIGKVKAGIEQLGEAIKQFGARTVGEYFALLSAGTIGEDKQRIRARWTDRRWFLDEFERIWNKQSEYHTQLTLELKKRVHHLLFFQRPIARNEHLIGMCQLETDQRRGPMASLRAQRFRLLQRVNDLEYEDGFETKALNVEQRTLLLQKLESEGDLKFDSIRQLLGFKKSVRFNLERGGEKKLPGNRTNARMLGAIPKLWPSLSQSEKDSIVNVHLKTDDNEQLVQGLMAECGLAEDDAKVLCRVQLEDGYHRLSIKAVERLLPQMESGVPFKTAEDQVYGTTFSGGKVYDFVPPVEDVLPQIPNPAVMRAVTELRKVTNALVREYGKPAEVRIELARELKRNARQRENDWKLMRGRQSEREKARKRILDEAHRPEPSGMEIQKVLLYEECGGICPYCGDSLGGFQGLFDGDIEIDHILPRNRFPDNSFANKTLAHRNCNQNKLGRTPFEAFGANEERWSLILGRVQKWHSPEKLQRFEITDPTQLDPDNPDGFAARRLNDTRYTSKLAARYVGTLYGGRDIRQADGSTRRVIFASSGLATATLRREWGLESILREADPADSSRKPAKPRGDHRHHAIDAIVIALSTNAAIQRLSAAAAGGNDGMARLGRIPSPWQDFVPSIRPLIGNMTVSHRPCHKLFGPLHDETNYSAPRETLVANGKRKPQTKTVVHVRKFVHTLSSKQIEDIVDPAVRAAVKDKVEKVGGNPKKLENNWPLLRTRTGKEVPILRARVRMRVPVTRIAAAERERYVSSAANHHVAIYATKDRKGKTVWATPGVVDRLEAVRRWRETPSDILRKEQSGLEDAEYLFHLMGGDMVRMDHPAHPSGSLFVVRTISEGSDDAIEVDLVRDCDARLITEIKKDDKQNNREGWVRARSIDALRQWNCRKIFVDVLGKVRW